MNALIKEYGGLACVVVDNLPEGTAPRALAIICHGFGAGGRDLVPLAPELFEIEPRLSEAVRFVFPAAPLAPEEFAMFGGRAWWLLNVARLIEGHERGELRELLRHSPRELPEVRGQMMKVIDEATRDAVVAPSQLILGGFSQGSMVALDAALHMSDTPLGVCIWSGALLGDEEWKSRAADRSGLNVLQSHGRYDPLLPFEAALWLREMLQESGASVEFIEFPGEHAIPPLVMERTAAAMLRWLA
jgi:phospholipase/carboxylesterase